MGRKVLALIFGLATIAAGCTGIPKGLEPITDFEPDRYLGKWYEIARLDHSFERHLSNVTATYTRAENGEIQVVNRGFNAKTGSWEEIKGHARLRGSVNVGSLKVSFFWPFYAAYHIIALDRQDYSYAMVTGPNRSYLWILSRKKQLDESIYLELVAQADAWGFDTGKLIRVEQDLPEEKMVAAQNMATNDSQGKDRVLTPCPAKPNCVSSVDKDPKHYVEPLRYAGSVADARNRLLEVISSLKRSRVKTLEEHYLHAEFVSAVFRFVDDVEFLFDDRNKIIHLKSASRVGYSDLGVNRRRIEKIRIQFDQKK